MDNFKRTYTLEDRIKESNRVLDYYPDRVPIILDLQGDLLLIGRKTKYLIPDDITIAQFIFIFRKKIELTPEESIFIFINNTIPRTNEIMKNIYKTNKDEDGFLYVQISKENVFG